MYQVSFVNVEQFLSYELRLKFCEDAEDDAAKGIIKPDFIFFKKQTS